MLAKSDIILLLMKDLKSRNIFFSLAKVMYRSNSGKIENRVFMELDKNFDIPGISMIY